MKTLVLLFIFTTILCLFYAIFLLFFEHRYTVKNRMIHTGKFLDRYEAEEAKQQNSMLKGMAQQTIKNIEKSNYYAKIKTKLLQAYIKMKPIEFIEVSIISGLTLASILYMLASNVLMTGVGFLLGFKVPESVIETIRKKRAAQLNDQLPQALSLVANGLRAGFSFSQAMAVVGREMEAPIADEFSKVLRDNSYGKNMSEALQDLGKRTDDEDLDIFITTLQIHLQVGGDLSEILDTISETIRERVKLKGDIRTLISQSKMSAWVIGSLPVAIGVILFIIRPEYLGTMVGNPIGLLLMGIAGGMILLGAFVLTKIVKVKL
jgi:tight adherence protein B